MGRHRSRTRRFRDDRPPGGIGVGLTLVPTALWIAACDAMEPNRPPEAALGSVALAIESDLTDPPSSYLENVAAWFADPDGDQLSYAARSSDPDVVAATIIPESDLSMTAIGAGSAAVTATATDPGGLFAALSIQVTVRRPNRPPQAIGRIPDVTVVEGKPFEVDAVWHFRDPDGDRLNYAATANDAEIVEIAADGSLFVVSAVSFGATTIVITATDPGGLSASHDLGVQAVAGPPGFRDDFDEALAGWHFANTNAEIADGALRWTNFAANQPGRVVRGATRRLTDWEATLRVGRAHEDAVVRLVVHTDDATAPSLGAEIGSGVAVGDRGTNARLLGGFDLGAGTINWLGLAAGVSDAIADGSGEFTEIAVAMRDRRFSMVAGSDTALVVDLGVLGNPSEVGVLAGLELWIRPLDPDATDRAGLIDWIELGGALAGDSPTTLPGPWSAALLAEQWRATGVAGEVRRPPPAPPR